MIVSVFKFIVGKAKYVETGSSVCTKPATICPDPEPLPEPGPELHTPTNPDPSTGSNSSMEVSKARGPVVCRSSRFKGGSMGKG